MMLNKESFYRILDEGREDNAWDFKLEITISEKKKFYELLKDILAFANSEGGHLLLGVEDRTHNLLGVTVEIDEAELVQKIETSLGYSIDCRILYFNDNEDETKRLGILKINGLNKICVSPKTFSSEKGVIVEQDAIYVRRGTRSIKANQDQLNDLVRRLQIASSYEFSEEEIRVIEKNKNSSYLELKQFDDYLKGEFEFTASSFGDKISQLCFDNLKNNRLEVGKWIGFEENKINEYFNGIAYPTLEHVLRAAKYFEVPVSFFFKPTQYSRLPIWESPIVNYCLIDKVTSKRNLLFNNNWGRFFSTVLWDLAENVCLFVKWIESDYEEFLQNEDNVFYLSNSDELYKYTNGMSPAEINEFKDFLSTQHYKVIQYGTFNKETLSRLPKEQFLFRLIGLGEDLVCRLVNESIKSIEVNKSDIEVKYHFIEEIKNRQYLGRDYNLDQMRLDIDDPSQEK
ncbi:AlbA family DNA-binding domain-containing protein [Paenibacillus sp. FSL H3-0333]|uniref:AlbA family DNA-binding domain-containing protein n=1 Tax=Paenibacillus sp. FSL H3-0333 TaxID=2921373 RepID=UPI0030FC96C3